MSGLRAPARREGEVGSGVIHFYFSQQISHVCFETCHSRLLSRWAALLGVAVIVRTSGSKLMHPFGSSSSSLTRKVDVRLPGKLAR